MRTPCLILLFVLAMTVPIRAQVSGRIIDERTGQGVPAARVTLEHDDVKHETLSDAQGRYTFGTITPAEYLLTVNNLGYQRSQLRVLVTQGHKLAVDVVITPQPIELAPLLVAAEFVVRHEALPMLAGDSLSMLYDYRRDGPHARSPAALAQLTAAEKPGPDPGTGTPHVLHNFGSGNDRGAVMIDGVLLNAPLHLGGVMPEFRKDMVPAASLRTGGASARYDGGTSYILDYRTRAPRAGQRKLRGDFSMLSLDAAVESALSQRATVMAGVRHTNGPLLEAMSNTLAGYNYGDAMARVDVDTDSTHVLQILTLGTRESIRVPRDQGYDDAGWNNGLFTLSWRPRADGEGWSASAGASRGSAILPLLSAPQGRLTATMDRATVALSYQWSASSPVRDAGLEVENVRLDRHSRAQMGACTNVLPCSSGAATTLAVYGDVEHETGAFELRAGLRANLMLTDGEAHLLPRFAATYKIDQHTSATLSFGRYSQVALEPAQPDASLLRIQRAVANQVEMRLLHATSSLALSGSAHLLHASNGVTSQLEPGAEVAIAAGVGPALLSAGFAMLERVPAGGERGRLQHHAFAGVSIKAGEIDMEASVLHGANLPLTSIVLDGVAPEVPELMGGGEGVPRQRSEHGFQTRVDAGVKGSWQLRLGNRDVRLTPYARVVNAFNSDALFYYQQGNGAELRPLSALPTMPVFGVQWEF